MSKLEDRRKVMRIETAIAELKLRMDNLWKEIEENYSREKLDKYNWLSSDVKILKSKRKLMLKGHLSGYGQADSIVKSYAR